VSGVEIQDNTYPPLVQFLFKFDYIFKKKYCWPPLSKRKKYISGYTSDMLVMTPSPLKAEPDVLICLRNPWYNRVEHSYLAHIKHMDIPCAL
jgi:hypothetical protein